MTKQIMAILDEDEFFVTRLAEYINKREAIPFRAVPFTEVRMLEKYAAVHDTGILLADENCLASLEGMAGSFPVCISLTKQKGERAAAREGSALYRYQPADRLISEIMSMIGSEALAESGPRPELIGVCSPAGRSGKTSLAIALGFALSAGKRTLYINLESTHGFYELGVCTAGRTDMSDLLYCFRTSPDQLPGTLQDVTERWQDLDYIVPARSCEDLKEIAADEWYEMFRKIAGAGSYGAMILDIDAGMKELCPLLSRCRSVYVPVIREDTSEAKVRSFLSALSEGGVNPSKIFTVQVPVPARTGRWPDCLSQGEIAAFAGRILSS